MHEKLRDLTDKEWTIIQKRLQEKKAAERQLEHAKNMLELAKRALEDCVQIITEEDNIRVDIENGTPVLYKKASPEESAKDIENLISKKSE